MIDLRLRMQLDGLVSRLRQWRVSMTMATVWVASTIIVGTYFCLNQWQRVYIDGFIAWLVVLGFVCASVLSAAVLFSRNPHRTVCRKIESRFPDLGSCLITALEQRPASPIGKLDFLQEAVVRKALEHSDLNAWSRVMPLPRVYLAHLANLLAFCVLFLSLVALADRMLLPDGIVNTTEASLVSSDEIIIGPLQVTIEPGDTEVERGSRLLVMARFEKGRVPAHAKLVVETVNGSATEMQMSRSLKDPVFGVSLPSVNEPLSYYVEYSGQRTDSYRVSVYETPKLVRADARLTFPEYTVMDERIVQDVRSISAVQGTQLELTCFLNKDVADARLEPKSGESLTLSALPSSDHAYHTSFQLQQTTRYRLQLTDSDGRSNADPPEIVVNVIPNNAPKIKITRPGRDTRISPLEELSLGVDVWDDFGLIRYGLTYTRATESPQDVELGNSVPAKTHQSTEHLLAMEDLEMEPDQLVSYHFWAEDHAPDGSVRRTFSDMYFAEIRHFEEIFRAREQPPGGSRSQQQQGQGSGATRQIEEAADSQKEIINATWKLIRRETSAAPSPKYVEDVKTIMDSQGELLQRATEMAEQIEDAQSKAQANEITRHMLNAFDELKRAAEDNSVEPLQSALAAEQSAYQALLKLRAREFQVTRGRQQNQQGRSGGGAQGNRSQQQLDELELSDEENRYETERLAQSPQQQGQREDRQILNRLRELAQRQNDLNERLKELQTALEQAETEEEREEIQRRLKRLREEEQEILQDTDELQNRMDRPENQERTSEARDQLQQTRDNVRQASEALEEGRVSRAVAAGTRAERDFQEMREEFRRRTSQQFEDEMRRMRADAQQLEEKQNEIAQHLDQLNNVAQQTKSLRDTGEREAAQNELNEQQQRMDDVVQQMRDVVEQAEITEPLLAEQLYDTIRESKPEDVSKALEEIGRAVEHGFDNEAQQMEELVRPSVERIREGVEQAAEKILGDGTDALRQAQDQLDRLIREVDEDAARNNPNRGDSSDRPQRENESPSEARPGSDERSSRDTPTEGATEQDSSTSSDQTRAGQASDEQSPSDRNGQQNRPTDGQSADEQTGRQEGQTGQSPSQNENAGGRGQRSDEGQESPRGGRAGEENRQASDQPNRRGGGRQGGGNPSGGALVGFNELLDSAAPENRPMNSPFAGEDFLEWSDRLRDVEEMIDEPGLRERAAQIRERARELRRDMKRHSKPPNWELIKVGVTEPLVELSKRISEELMRRDTGQSRVPLDRDPVPDEFAEQVRRYYERLGSGR